MKKRIVVAVVLAVLLAGLQAYRTDADEDFFELVRLERHRMYKPPSEWRGRECSGHRRQDPADVRRRDK